MRAVALALLAATAACGTSRPASTLTQPATVQSAPAVLAASDVVDGEVVRVDRARSSVQLRVAMRWTPAPHAVDEVLDVRVDDETVFEPPDQGVASLRPGSAVNLEASSGRAVRITLLDVD